MVGDPKQAIYGWRGADLRTFLDAVAAAVTRHGMEVNHRSDGRYLTACNRLLSRDEVFGTDEIDYLPVRPPDDDRAARLRDADGAPLPALQLVLHERPGGAGAEPTDQRLRRTTLAALASDLAAGVGDDPALILYGALAEAHSS